MIRLSFQDNSIIFTFEDSSHYLQGNGVIEAPKGSLALICDESNMANFVKAGSNDIFVSATYEELGMTKDELLETFAENAGAPSGGGLTPEEAQEMIDSSISGKADTSAVTTELADKLDISDFNTYSASTDSTIASKADASDLSALSGVVDTKASDSDLQALESVVGGKLDTSDFNTYSAATESTLSGKADTTAMTEALASKLNISDFNTYSGGVDTAIASKADTTAMTQALSAKQDTLVSGTNIKTINNTSILGSGNIEIQVEVDDELDIDSPNAVANSAITKTIQDNELVVANALIALQEDLDDKVDVSAYTAYTSATDSAISTINTALGGYKLAKMTTAEYEALTVKDESTIYFIVD